MFGKRFLTFAAFAGACLGALQAWSMVVVVEEEAVFEQVSRVSKKYDNCSNNGNTYHFEITGLVAGAEKTIAIRYATPSKADDVDAGRAEADMVAFCEKAALLTKSQPDKHDLYIQVKYKTTGFGTNEEVGLCTTTAGGGRERGTQLVCELR